MKYTFNFTTKNYESLLRAHIGLRNRILYLNNSLYISVFLMYLSIVMALYTITLYKAAFVFVITGLLLQCIFLIITSKPFLIMNSKYIARYIVKKNNNLGEQTVEVDNDNIIYFLDGYSISTKLCDIENVIVENELIIIIGPNSRVCACINYDAFNSNEEIAKFIEIIKGSC